MLLRYSELRNRKRTHLAAAVTLGLGFCGLGDQANAGGLFSGQFGTGNTWNVYERIEAVLTLAPETNGHVAVKSWAALSKTKLEVRYSASACSLNWLRSWPALTASVSRRKSSFMTLSSKKNPAS